MKHLTGPSGSVTTTDIHEDVAAHARKILDAAGYGEVRVITRDGALGASEHAPFDRMIATVGVWDLPAAWWDQLTVGGRLVLPLRWRGLTRSVAFVREKDRMRSDSVKTCGFLPMIGQDGEREGYVDADRLIKMHWDADQPIDPTALRSAIGQPGTYAWTEATVGPEDPFDGVWLRMTATEPGTCRITVKPAAIERGLRRPAVPALSPALVEGDSLAYLALQRLASGEGAEPRFSLGAVGYGPDGFDLAERVCEQIQVWDRDRDAEPVITAYPAGTPDSRLVTGHLIEKPSARLVISY
jgi:protein-L-isoaspartate(D-aspartate) O-methyltransferase